MYDDVEHTSSHFISTLEHWQEVNLSGNFTDFAYQVRNYTQSLPQIIHHQSKIFDALYDHIDTYDPHSIQPLLELLAQFVHDLGSDFMVYYPRILKLLTKIALDIKINDLQNNVNSSNLLEWTFNCISFMFKYLASSLVEDYRLTFDILLPILSLNRQQYIARFCSEALSYLIKRMKQSQLNEAVRYLLIENIELIRENVTFKDSLVVLFSEAITSTKESFHSKGPSMYDNLIKMSLVDLNSNIIVSGVLANIFAHGNPKSIDPFVTLTLQHINSFVDSQDSGKIQNFDQTIEILTSLIFSESGKKTLQWNQISELVLKICQQVQSIDEPMNIDSLLFCLSLLVRNCEPLTMNKNFKKVVQFLTSYNEGCNFLPYVDSTLGICEKTFISLGITKYVQEFINRSSGDAAKLKQISYFVIKNSQFPVVILNDLQQSLLDSIDLDSVEYSNLIEIYWKLNLIDPKSPGIELTLSETFLQNLPSKSLFAVDLLGKLLTFTRPQDYVLKFLSNNFKSLMKSSALLDSFAVALSNSKDFASEETLMDFIDLVTENLNMGDNTLRISSVNFIIKALELCSKECPEFISSIKVVETMPLTIANARDIQLRVRMLVTSFLQMETKTDLDCRVISNFMFGFMSNKFQPCWQIVFESLPRISGLCESHMWNLCIKFLTYDYKLQEDLYITSDGNDMQIDESASIDDINLIFNDTRITTAFENALNNSYMTFRAPVASIFDRSESSNGTLKYDERMRGLTIEGLMKIPEVAQSHNSELTPLILDKQLTLDWTLKERNLLLSVFAKFKNLKNIKDGERLHKDLLNTLSSQRLPAQKLALDVILNFKNPSTNKYKDQLKNLLDDTLFKDELTKLLSEDLSIAATDMEHLMPLILRILFGRVQGSTKSNSQNSKKNAVINVLPSLSQDQIKAFFKLGYDKIGYQGVIDVSSDDFSQLNRINGFVNLLFELYDVLGYNFSDALISSIQPLIFSMAMAQKRLDSAPQLELTNEDNEDFEQDNEEESSEVKDDKVQIKVAKRIRQLGMRCLNELFKLLGKTFEWDIYFDPIYKYVIEPRLKNFDKENLQQPSSLLSILVSWIKLPNINKFLLIDDFKPARAIISLIESRKVKESVLSVALDFAINCLQSSFVDEDGHFFTLLAILVETLLKELPVIIESTLDSDIIAKSATILLLLIDGDYITDDFTRNSLIDSLSNVFDKPQNKIAVPEREKILISLSILFNDCNLSFQEVENYFFIFSRALRVYKEKSIRANLVDIFKSIGSKFEDMATVSRVIEGMNSYTSNNTGGRLGEPNYELLLKTYKEFNEELFSEFSPTQWVPVIYSALFFLNDEEELVIRTNAGYVLNKFVDVYSSFDSIKSASEYIHLFKTILLPDIREGLKNPVEVIQTEYVNVLAYAVKNSQNFTDLEDMKVLLYTDDEEASFFANINHIQLHRRQRAIRRAASMRESLKPSSISHYILPLIEGYIYNQEEKLRNVSMEAVVAMGLLVRNVSWNQFKAMFKRYVAKLRVAHPENLKVSVNVVVEVSKSLLTIVELRRTDETIPALDTLKEFPRDTEAVDAFVLGEIVPVLQRILNERNDETIVDRIPLSEGLVNLVKSISETKVDEQLPGLLTSTCQVLRSRSEELRNGARKSLCNIASSLGAKYLKFLLQELKGALTRGSQIHVLSFTMHSLLVAVSDKLEHGDLDESIDLIVSIIMEDIFGAAGQEKDAEGYTSKMKEVKHKKSNDSGELLTSNISLADFNKVIEPVKLVLQERLSLKVQNKLDELLRRYALGLNHNEESDTRNILILSFQINQQSVSLFEDDERAKLANQKINDKHNNETSQDHFLVKVNARPLKTQIDFNQYKFTLQKFAFELLRAAISRHPSLLTVGNMEQFVPMLEGGVESNHEGLIAVSLRLLHTLVQLPFSEETNQVFKKCARKALSFIKDSPSTIDEVCQASLRFLATLIRHRSEVSLKDSAISYVLERIQPDLEEPKSQGLAFNFLKSVVSQHIMLPEVYDLMQVVSKIMVVNHNREIRDMARSIYFQFLMEYDQGRGKLEKQFKFLVNNLSYPTQEGRQSVLELVNSIVTRSGDDLLNKIALSFFVALANILVNDDSSKCREMSSLIIQKIMGQCSKASLQYIEEYLSSWLKQTHNSALSRCALSVYKVYLSEFSLHKNRELDELALAKINSIFGSASRESQEGADEIDEVEWQVVYTALNVFSGICREEKQKIVSSNYEQAWTSIMNTLLYPHSWVRLSASRLIGVLISNLENCKFTVDDYTIQTVAYRLLHQISAPSITGDLGDQAIKNLILIAGTWNKNGTKYIHRETENSKLDKDDEDAQSKYDLACEFLSTRTCAIIRQELQNSLASKKASIKLAAMLVQMFEGDLLLSTCEKLIHSLYNYTDSQANAGYEEELVQLSSECLQVIEKKLGGSQYTELYAKVQKAITIRRQERRTKRAQMAVSNPDVIARRKMKKHSRFREKRKHEKDENGYYHSKKKRYT